MGDGRSSSSRVRRPTSYPGDRQWRSRLAPCRPSAAERATMFVALELSKSSWLVALHSPVADKVSLHRFVGGDVTGLLALIARKQTQAEARLGRGAGRTEGTDRLCLVAARPYPARVA